MKRLTVSSALLLAVLALLVSTLRSAAARPATSSLVINEVYAPSAASPATQYFEIYNGGAAAVDLSSYVIYNSGGSDRLNVLPNPVVQPRQALAVGATVFANQKIGTGLNPAGDFLALVQSGPQDVTIDQLNWGTVNPNWPNYQRFQPFWNNPPTMPTDINRSLQRYPNGFDSDQPSDFLALPVSPSNPPPTLTPYPDVGARDGDCHPDRHPGDGDRHRHPLLRRRV